MKENQPPVDNRFPTGRHCIRTEIAVMALNNLAYENEHNGGEIVRWRYDFAAIFILQINNVQSIAISIRRSAAYIT